MILITGGLGFIGLHTARAVIDAGEQCVLTQYRVAREPDFIKGEIGTNAFVEQLDVTDTEGFLALGKKYSIDGIVHLAVPGLGALSPLDDLDVNMTGLSNALRAADEWKVKRLSVASSISVYHAIDELPYKESMYLPMHSSNPTEAFKKSYEILSSHLADRLGLDCVSLRIAGIYGPLYHSMANLPSRLVHAAVKGTTPDLTRPAFLEDGGDMCYVRDCGRGIAAVQLSTGLTHRTYNVASGVGTTNAELLAAVKAAVPEAEIELQPGKNPRGDGIVGCQDITWIREDTGYTPQFTIESAIADYVAWLRAGNQE